MENRKKIVVLDGYTLCAGELNFDALREFGEVTVYDRVAQADVAARIGDAQSVLTNKALITAEVMDACPRMEYVGVTATGYNVVDVAEAKRRGSVVTNAPAYSTQAVAQHTFALLQESLSRVAHTANRCAAARGRRAGISAFLQSRWRKSPERRSA